MAFIDDLDRSNLHIQFLTKKHVRIAAIGSLMILLLATGALLVNKLNFGIDFTGGTLVQVSYQDTVELTEVRAILQENDYPDAVVQRFGGGSDVLIRVGQHGGLSSEEISTQILKLLADKGHQVEMRRVEYIGPQVGAELVEAGGLAILYTLIGILIYVAFRFEYRFAIGAVLALIHDSIITVGFFALTGMEFDLTVLAAILAVIGYSLNDTIVVFDRMRDNFIKMRKKDASEVMNASLNQTLIRTLMTSVTTLLVVLALFFLGGELIHGFSAALMVGIIVGTYSSIYVAGSATLALGISKADLMPPQKEGAEFSDPQP